MRTNRDKDIVYFDLNSIQASAYVGAVNGFTAFTSTET